ncbi:MAG: SidA/IucD/PvdA family monooxygenase [Ketobacter sp.]|nr:SidA/IucD/PvdA family monooxygenase [Ketobacter sp.]
MNQQHVNLAGIGAGPFNLSVAALLQKCRNTRYAFFDKKPEFSWHSGLMLPGAKLQTSWMKDLVTPVDPTSPYSFLKFLVEKRRFYSFINAEQSSISRQEFAQYLDWVAQQLPAVRYNAHVREVNYQQGRFWLRFDDRIVSADHLCVGTGTQPYVPEFAVPYLGKQVLHAGGILNTKRDFTGLKVAVIGGGQTGAEIFQELISERWGECESIAWVSRRENFDQLDEAPFTNDLFTPSYVKHFLALPQEEKQAIVARQKLASDGISPATLKEIYQSLYHTQVVCERGRNIMMLPDRQLVSMLKQGGGYELMLMHSGKTKERIDADVVIFSTGFRTVIPSCLEPLAEQIQWESDGVLSMDDNYQVNWECQDQSRIYAVNASRHHHGIVDPQTSLMAWRAANIVNDLLGYELYKLEQPGFVQWGVLPATAKERFVA